MSQVEDGLLIGNVIFGVGTLFAFASESGWLPNPQTELGIVLQIAGLGVSLLLTQSHIAEQVKDQ